MCPGLEGAFESISSGPAVQWPWAAATYHSVLPTSPSACNSIGAKPTEGEQCENSGRAGTLGNEKGLQDGGGVRGGGGSNDRGGGTAHFTLCMPRSPTFAVAYADSYQPRPPAGLPSPWHGGNGIPNPPLPAQLVGAKHLARAVPATTGMAVRFGLTTRFSASRSLSRARAVAS